MLPSFLVVWGSLFCLIFANASSINSDVKTLGRRKGGGGGGGGGKGGGGGSSGGSSGGSNRGGSSGGGSSSSGSRGSSSPVSVGPSNTRSSTTYGGGGGRVNTIPAGTPFAGRTQGGGTRDQVYGSSTYGSGYPGTNNVRGVGGLGFPYYYWPLAWGGAAVGGGAYLHNNEYGRPDNSSRPGGVMMVADFKSSTQSDIYHVISDNATVVALIDTLKTNCTSFLSSDGTSSTPSTYNESNTNTQPESTIQYYRASSVALTLQGYNNTAADSQDNNTSPTPLPSGIDTNLLNCLNSTIGQSVPLVDGAFSRWSTQSTSTLLGAVYIVWFLSSWI